MKHTPNTEFKFYRSNIRINLHELRRWFLDYTFGRPPDRQNKQSDAYKTHETFGKGAWGWQLFEANLEGATPIEEEGMSLHSPLMSKRMKYRFPDGEVRKVRNQDFTVRKNGVNGYFAHILDHFPEAYRCGMKSMHSGFGYKLHVDPPRERHYRIHIPIWTNDHCGHEVLGTVTHMPDDGYLWFMNTGVEHRAWNHGDSSRTHIYWQMPIETLQHYKNLELEII